MPEAEYNLLGRDVIIELGVNLEVTNKELTVKLCTLTIKDEEKINPEVCYTSDSVGKLDIAPFEEPRDPCKDKTISYFIGRPTGTPARD